MLLLLLAGCAAPMPEAVRPAGPDDPVVRPAAVSDRDGVDLLAELLARWERPVEESALERELRDLERSGVGREEAWVMAAHTRSLWAHSQYGLMGLLLARLDSGVPVVVQLPGLRADRKRRFALVDRYDATRKVVHFRFDVATPAAWPQADFVAQWAGARYWMMTLCPPDAARWELSPLEHVSRMQVYDVLGRFAEADADAARALLLDGRNNELCLALAVRERRRGRADAAEELLRRILARDATSARVANNLAFLLAEQGRNLDEAERLARNATLQEPGNPRLLHTLGFVLQVQGRWPEALPLYELAHRRARTLPAEIRRETGLHLARAYARLERPAEAGVVLRELMREEPGLLLPGDLAGLIRQAP